MAELFFYIPDTMNTPPPIPRAGSQKKSFFHIAARLALLPPLIVIFLSPLERSHPGRGAVLLLGATMVGLLLLGAILSIVGLCGIGRHGAAGLLGFGMAGLGINGLLLFIFITNFAAARLKAREVNRQFDALSAELVTNAAQNYNPTSGVDGGKQLKLLSDYRRKLKAVSQRASGDDAAMMQASEAILQRIQVAGQKVVAADNHCHEAGIFDFESLTNRNELAIRRRAILDLKTANAQLRELLTNRTAIAISELRSRGVPEDKIQSFVEGFSRSETQALTVKLRSYVDDYCDACVSLQDVLDKHWGKWRFDSTLGTVVFDDPSVQNEFGHLAKSILAIRKKEIALQGEILKHMGQSPK